MNELTARLASGSNTQLAGAGALAGILVGGGIYLNLSGVILGLVIGLGICGLLVTLAALAARMTGIQAAATPVPVHVPAAFHVPAPAATLVAAATPAMQAGGSTVATLGSTVPPAAGLAPAKIEATETEAQMLAAGRFADYHLAKAKRMLAAQDYKEAAHQAAASLAHGDLAEAARVRKSALAAAVR